MLCGEPGLVHAEGGGEEGSPVWDGEGGGGGRAAGEVAELGGGGVRGEEGCAGPAAEGEHGGYLGDPLRVGGVAGKGVEAEPAAVESAVEGVPQEEAGAEAGALLAAVACDDDIGEGAEGGQRAGVVLRGGAYSGGGEEVDGDVEGSERLRQGRAFGEPGGGAAWGDEGRCGGYREGVGAPRGAEVSAEEVEGGPVRQEGGAGTALLEGEVEEGRVSPGGQTEGVAVCIVDGDLMGAEGGGGDEYARGDVVEGGEAEGVQGAELEYGAGLAVAAGLARPVEGRAGLVDDAEEGELGEDGDGDDLRGGGGGGAGVLRDVGGDEGGPARAGVDEGELLLVGVDDAAGAA